VNTLEIIKASILSRNQESAVKQNPKQAWNTNLRILDVSGSRSHSIKRSQGGEHSRKKSPKPKEMSEYEKEQLYLRTLKQKGNRYMYQALGKIKKSNPSTKRSQRSSSPKKQRGKV
jgi:hypothetical protein